MSDILAVVDRPSLQDPVLLIALDGWIDAGAAGQIAARAVLESCEVGTIAEFDSDNLVDHRSRRPTLEIVGGVHGALTWPELRLVHGRDRSGRDFVILDGPEPDYRWREFSDSVVGLAGELGVTMAIGLGAYPAAVPHTRPVRVVATASSPELAARVGTLDNDLEAPIGAQAVILKLLGDGGTDSIGCWAQVPHYAAAMAYPAGAVALIRTVTTLTGLSIDGGDLDREVTSTRHRIDELVRESPDAQRLVAGLEEAADAYEPADSNLLPSGEDLAAELQRFLEGDDGAD